MRRGGDTAARSKAEAVGGTGASKKAASAERIGVAADVWALHEHLDAEPAPCACV